MPWEKSFDIDQAVDDAIAVFWEKGYDSTSIADVLECTGLNKGSLYNTFGDKRQLFSIALSKYDDDIRKPLISNLEAMDNPRKAIETYLDFIASDTISDKSRKGCFLFNTVMDINTHSAEIRTLITSAMNEIEAFLKRCIELGQVRGQISQSIEAKPTAKAILALVVSMRILGRGVFSQKDLKMIAEQGKKLIS